MLEKPVYVRKPEGYIVDSPDGQEPFGSIGDVVVGLKFYLKRHKKELGKAKPVLDYTEVDEADQGILEKGLYNLYTFRKRDERL